MLCVCVKCQVSSDKCCWDTVWCYWCYLGSLIDHSLFIALMFHFHFFLSTRFKDAPKDFSPPRTMRMPRVWWLLCDFSLTSLKRYANSVRPLIRCIFNTTQRRSENDGKSTSEEVNIRIDITQEYYIFASSNNCKNKLGIVIVKHTVIQKSEVHQISWKR